MSELSELLLRYLPEGWSHRRVGQEATKQKVAGLSEPTAVAYLSGKHGTPSDATIAAFVQVLGVPEHLVRKAAGVRAINAPWSPPSLSRYLRDDQRAALEQLIATMVSREEGEGHDRPAANTPPPDGPGNPLYVIEGEAAREDPPPDDPSAGGAPDDDDPDPPPGDGGDGRDD